MSRLVDADNLIKKINELTIDLPGSDWMKAKVLLSIVSAPTVDAAPIVHAKALEQSIYDKTAKMAMYKAPQLCSNCMDYVTKSWKYCPNCGAKMDG